MRYNPVDKDQKKKRLRRFMLIVLVLTLLFFGWVVIKNKWPFSTTMEQKTVSKKESSVSISDESKRFQDALNSLKTLFKDGDPTKYRTDITKEEFKKVEEKINAVSDDEAKNNLQDKLNKIKSAQPKDSETKN